MANYSNDTYKINRNKNYVNVRSQMGIPVVDADWNEMDDIRKYELQNFIKNFIGDGVLGDDDFRIFGGFNGEDNFVIFPGYCLMDGNVVYNDGDFRYSDQPFPDQDLADRPLTQLIAPQHNTRIDTVYLDVWEREVDSKKDPDLVNPKIGIETCVRIKREWVVRVVVGIEGSGEPANIPIDPEHCYYTLATLIRYVNDKTISSKNIIDQRFAGMNLRDSIARSVDLSRIHKVPLLQQTLFGRGVPAVSVRVGSNPSNIAFDGMHIWVANNMSKNVSKIDITGNTVVESVAVEDSPLGVAFDGTYIWVANNMSKNVSKIDITRNKVVESVAVGDRPADIAFDGTHIWVTVNQSNNVSKIDIAKNKVMSSVLTGYSPSGVAFDGMHIWVANYGSDNVSKIDITRDTVVASVAVNHPLNIAFDGTHIWVTHLSDNVSKIDITRNKVVASVAVGGSPAGIAFDGTHIWVANYGSSNVSKIDIARNTVVASIAVGYSSGIAFDGTHIWVANSRSNIVSKIKKII